MHEKRYSCMGTQFSVGYIQYLFLLFIQVKFIWFTFFQIFEEFFDEDSNDYTYNHSKRNDVQICGRKRICCVVSHKEVYSRNRWSVRCILDVRYQYEDKCNNCCSHKHNGWFFHFCIVYLVSKEYVYTTFLTIRWTTVTMRERINVWVNVPKCTVMPTSA